MRKILRKKGKLVLFYIVLVTLSCSNLKEISKEGILVTNKGIPNISIGDTLYQVIEKDNNYVKEIQKNKSSNGIEFMKLILRKNDEDIAYINYDEESLEWEKVSKIVCTSPKCITKSGISVGMSILSLRNIYPEKDDALKGGKNSEIGYFIPEDLKDKDGFFVKSQIVIELEKTKEDTIITALIVESY